RGLRMPPSSPSPASGGRDFRPALPCEGRGSSASRRRALRVIGAGACRLVVRPAAATPARLPTALRVTFGGRPITSRRAQIEIPCLAENGSLVPVVVSVDSPMSAQDYVSNLHLFAERNPLPRILEVELGPLNGRARITARIRLAVSQQVRAVAV